MAAVSSAGSLLWEVLLPEARGSSLSSGSRPKAELIISTTDRGEEHFLIPLSVGKALLAELETGMHVASSRAELLYHYRELSSRYASLRVERLIDRRDYSRSELEDKLRMDGFPSSVREAVLTRCVECGMVNDGRYAEVLIRSKLAAGWGVMRIEHELNRRGIEPSLISGWPEAFLDGQDEDERALEVARTRRISSKNGYEKLVRYLCSRGYSLSCSMRVARIVVDEAAEA